MSIKKVTSNCKICGKFYKTTLELPICKKCLNTFHLKWKREEISDYVEDYIEACAQIVGDIQTTTTITLYEGFMEGYPNKMKHFSKSEKVIRTFQIQTIPEFKH